MKVSDKNKNAIKAKLNDAGGDLSGRWFVYYSIPNPITGKLKRKKVYEGFAECKTVEDKCKNAKNLIAKINRQLESGRDPAGKKYVALPVDLGRSPIISQVPTIVPLETKAANYMYPPGEAALI